MFDGYIQWDIRGDDDHEPMTDYAITHKLSSLGIPTPGENRGGNPRIRASGMWAYGTVRRIWVSETYAGVFRFGRTATYHKGHKRQVRSQPNLFVFNVPPRLYNRQIVRGLCVSP